MNHVLKNTAVLFLVAACVVLWARCNGGNGQADGDADDIARDDEVILLIIAAALAGAGNRTISNGIRRNED